MRSEPGRGRKVALYLLHNDTVGDDVLRPVGDHNTVIIPTQGEDYSICGAPVTVKSAASVSKEELIARLSDLLGELSRPESDLFISLPTDKDAPQLDQSPTDTTF